MPKPLQNMSPNEIALLLSDLNGSLHETLPEDPVVLYASKTQVTVLGGINYFVGQTRVWLPDDVTVTVSSALDTGSIHPGTDYSVYLTVDGGVVISGSPSCPSGQTSSGAAYDGSNTRRLGGFHTICRNVAADLVMAPASVFSPNLHPLAGWTAGDILPKSVWAVNFRPACDDPSGMVYVRPTDTWVDIYNASGTIAAPETRFGGTRLHSKSMTQFWTGYANVGKTLLDDMEFYFAALGSNCGTKESTSGSDASHPPTSDTTGGHVDTAGYPMVSAVGCEEMCGLQNQWLRQAAPYTYSGAKWDNTTESTSTKGFDGAMNSFGSHYYMGQYKAVYAGGNWPTASLVAIGPLYRNANYSRSTVSVSSGGRGSSRSLHSVQPPDA